MTKNDKNYHHGNLAQALVAAGMEILETEGLDKLSLRAIAARVGVSHTAPKNHFGSRQGLLTAIGTEGFRRHAAYLREGLPEGADRKARLHAAMRGYVGFARAHPALFELMFSPVYCDFKDAKLLDAARDSYAILEDIATGLDWDKAGAPQAQLRSEALLWSLVHGYAKLLLGAQLREEVSADILDILPDFSYLPQETAANAGE